MSSSVQRRSGLVIPRQASRFQKVAAWGLSRMVSGLTAACRFEFVDAAGGLSLARHEPVIFALWHNRLGFALITYRRIADTSLGGRRLAALVSASRDGAFLATVLEAFRVVPVRGSSSRRGAQALVEMKSLVDKGLHVAITPDGPRGPRYQAQLGVLGLARVTGLPIVPFSVNTRSRWTARSWDRFQFPRPWARCEVVFGEPLRVLSSWDDAALERARGELEASLMQITRDV